MQKLIKTSVVYSYSGVLRKRATDPCNTGMSFKMLCEEPDTEECIWCDSMDMKSQTRQNSSPVTEIRNAWEGMMDGLGRRSRQFSR